MVILSDLQKFACLDKQFASFVMNWLKSGNIGKSLKFAKFLKNQEKGCKMVYATRTIHTQD